MPTTLRVVSTSHQASTTAAALDVALAERDHWQAVADSRLRTICELTVERDAARANEDQLIAALQQTIAARNALAERVHHYERARRWWG